MPQGALTLTVGYHEVEGKLAALKKPLVVLRRAQAGGAGESAYEAVGASAKTQSFTRHDRVRLASKAACLCADGAPGQHAHATLTSR